MRANLQIEDIVNEPWTIATLVEKEEAREREGSKARSLRDLIVELENDVLANAGVDVFEEVFKLVFTKLYDEMACHRGSYAHLRFRNSTPRWVIDMCVKMLNPRENETVIDPACGSAGFTVHAMFHVWRRIIKELGLPDSHLFTMDQKPARCEDPKWAVFSEGDDGYAAVLVAENISLSDFPRVRFPKGSWGNN